MVTLRIESSTRWDALALTQKLSGYHWFLVEPEAERWDICVPLDEKPQDDLPSDLEQCLLEWLNERGLEAATIHTETVDFVLSRA